jgi:hypothetical protein
MNAPAQMDFGFPRPTPLQPEPEMAKEKQSVFTPSRRSYRRTEIEAREWESYPKHRFLSWQWQQAYEVGVRHVGEI